MAGLLARDSSSGRLPGHSTSDIMPFVLAYSGGSAGDFHPSSLSSPFGHLDPIYTPQSDADMLRKSIEKILICQQVGQLSRYGWKLLKQKFQSYTPTENCCA